MMEKYATHDKEASAANFERPHPAMTCESSSCGRSVFAGMHRSALRWPSDG
jgi:hypothetical protein